MKLPLSCCAASPSLTSWEGDDTFAAGRRGRLGPCSLPWQRPPLVVATEKHHVA